MASSPLLHDASPFSIQRRQEQRGGDTAATEWMTPQDFDGKSNAWQASFNFGNSILGYGLLQIPFAFKNAGLVPGIVTSVIMAVLSGYSVHLLMRVARAHGVSNYEKLCAKALGDWGMAVLAFFQFAFAVAGMTAYAIGLRESLAPAIRDLSSYDAEHIPWYYSNDAAFAIVAVVAILPLCFVWHISSLWWMSLAACLAPVAVTTLMGSSITTFQVHGDSLQIGFGDHFAQAFGTISFAFVCQHQAFQVYNSMRESQQFHRVLLGSMTASFAILLSLAVLGYCTFRSDTLANIFDNYTGAKPTPSLSDRVPMLVGQLVMCVNLVGSFPVNLLVARHTIKVLVDSWLEARSFDQWGRPVHDWNKREDWLEEVLRTIRSPDSKYSKWMHVGVTATLWLACCMVPRFSGATAAIQIIGAFAAAGLAFILPPLCYISLGDRPDDEHHWLDMSQFWRAYLVLIVGLGSLVLAVVAAVDA